MKKIIPGLLIIVVAFSCSKKTIPVKTEEKKDTIAAVPKIAALVVIDGMGRVVTPESSLPDDASVHADYLKISRAFTPKQLANLKARYNTVPPKILYVYPYAQLKSYKGTYYVYRKKFWYWKQSDGLFYLYENYYN